MSVMNRIHWTSRNSQIFMQDNMQLQICVYIYTHICTVECVYIHAQCSVYIYGVYMPICPHTSIYIYTYIPHRDHLVHLLSLHLLFQLTLCSHHSLQGLLRGYGYPFISSNPWLDMSFIVGWNIKRILIIGVYTIPVRLPKFATKLPLTTIPWI